MRYLWWRRLVSGEGGEGRGIPLLLSSCVAPVVGWGLASKGGRGQGHTPLLFSYAVPGLGISKQHTLSSLSYAVPVGWGLASGGRGEGHTPSSLPYTVPVVGWGLASGGDGGSSSSPHLLLLLL